MSGKRLGRNKMIKTAVSKDEHEAITIAARRESRTVADWSRRRLLGDAAPARMPNQARPMRPSRARAVTRAALTAVSLYRICAVAEREGLSGKELSNIADAAAEIMCWIQAYAGAAEPSSSAGGQVEDDSD